MYEVKVLADSICNGNRLTTLEVTLPRIVLAELNTHRMLSKNSASSRAIPVQKQIERVMQDPFIPIYWGKNQKGMQANAELAAAEQDAAQFRWLRARNAAVDQAMELLALGVHKQITNRLLEPFMWHTVIISATEWQNAENLRCHPNAQPEIRKAFEMIRAARASSEPSVKAPGEWHLPLVFDHDYAELIRAGFNETAIALISCARCARVSYLTHDGVRDPHADLTLAAQLSQNGHMSPFEHAARAQGVAHQLGNFYGWTQYRKLLPGEAIYGG